MAYPSEFKENVKECRREGLSLNELSRKFNLSKGTLSVWLRDVEVCEQGQQRLQARLEKGQRYFIENPDHAHGVETYRKLREKAYQMGLTADVSFEDALAVGLYMGDGCKRSVDRNPGWSFSNADFNHIRIEREWAVRAGQPLDRFRAKIQVHPRDAISDENVKRFWGNAGIPIENIQVKRLRSSASKKRTRRVTPYGTCHLYPCGNGVTLYCYYKGQRDQILGRRS